MEQKTGLELVHFQITRGCNLRCWFCGQWGKHGFFHDAAGTAMALDDWLRITDELKSLSGKLPSVILWGGEPLMSPYFDELAEHLYADGFSLGMVTNGTLLDRHAEVCRRCFKQIYVSVDGEEPVHDSIRGQGVFRKVRENLQLLRGGNAKISLMTVLTEQVLERLPQTLDAFAAFGADEVLLQELIALTPAEIARYHSWLSESFGQMADEIDGWEGKSHPDPDRAEKIAAVLRCRKDPFSVSYLPHGEACGQHCLSPWKHAHVTWNGNVTFCTDFYDFSAGNVYKQSLCDVLAGCTAERFRQEIAAGNNPTCAHCSWRNSKSFYL